MSPSQDNLAPNVPSRAELRRQSARIRRVVAKLGWPWWLVRGVAVLVGLWLFWMLASRILAFGDGVSYDWVGPSGAAVVDLLERINPYLWWVAVVIVGLILLAIVRAIWWHSVQREHVVPVPPDDLAQLNASLSPPVREVLAWVWRDRTRPLAQGDLRQTLAELRAGRLLKIRLAREQAQVLSLPPANFEG